MLLHKKLIKFACSGNARKFSLQISQEFFRGITLHLLTVSIFYMQRPQRCQPEPERVPLQPLAFAVAQTADQYFTNNAKRRMHQQQRQPQEPALNFHKTAAGCAPSPCPTLTPCCERVWVFGYSPDADPSIMQFSICAQN